MSASRTILKIIGIITILAAVLQLIAGIMIVAGAGLLEGQTIEASGQVVDAASGATILGGFAIVLAVIDLIVGLLALRGAKDPAKVGPFKVVAIIGLLLCIAQLIMFAVSGQIASFGIGGWVQLIALFLCVVLAFKVSGERNAQ